MTEGTAGGGGKPSRRHLVKVVTMLSPYRQHEVTNGYHLSALSSSIIATNLKRNPS